MGLQHCNQIIEGNIGCDGFACEGLHKDLTGLFAGAGAGGGCWGGWHSGGMVQSLGRCWVATCGSVVGAVAFVIVNDNCGFVSAEALAVQVVV